MNMETRKSDNAPEDVIEKLLELKREIVYLTSTKRYGTIEMGFQDKNVAAKKRNL